MLIGFFGIHVLLTVIAAESTVLKTPSKTFLNKPLPEATFDYTGRIESGYLKGNEGGNLKLFYMLFASQSKVENIDDNVPLLLWLNGGPGYSSLFGAFAEIGPFLVNKDGSLYQNAYAFNRKADLLFLETPIGTGFSYDTKNLSGVVVGDSETAEMNAFALKEFFKTYKEKRKQDFFIAGQSYAAVYASTLAREIVKNNLKSNEDERINLKGVMIGNGLVDTKVLYNSLIPFIYYHGFVDEGNWEKIKKECCKGTDVDECDFSMFGDYTKGTYFPRNDTQCGLQLRLATRQPKGLKLNDINQQCYEPDSGVKRKCIPEGGKSRNTGWELSYESTDPQFGFPCWYQEALKTYFNKKEVQHRIHIDKEWQDAKKEWSPYSSSVGRAYKGSNRETAPIYKEIVDNLKGAEFRVLIYNGDLDLVGNAPGADKFGKKLAETLGLEGGERTPWHFRDSLAGYQKSYTKDKVTLDVLTVKGAGRSAPMNRPGPCLQMFTNFFAGRHNYTLTDGFDPKPVLTE
ncbi:hypothetical protein AB6A40_002055 [Gnathostoma spinigerum]|uniref:Serine carboxypeptidase n=1 Tax=Gnathostoma spinigerum TaxID=75299 RepID=A0ABD6E847_9BILA